MFYCLTADQIRMLYYRKIKPAAVLSFENRLVFTYTGQDILEYNGRRYCSADQFNEIAESAANGIGDNLRDVVEEALGSEPNKYLEIDR